MGLPVSTFGLARLLRSRNGNVSMMYALVAPVLVFGAGAAIDYGRAAQIHTKLNAAADAAALAALTPAMLQQPATVAQAAAVSMFNGLTEGIPGLTAGATQVTVTITVGSTALVRNVEVNYATSVNTIFAQVLGVSALPVQGVSEASAQVPPNIDFYVLLDNSPSMALPSTLAGITQMQTLTAKETTGGCAFACHQASTNNGDTAGNPCADGTAPTYNSSMATASPASSAIYCNTSKHGAQIDNYQLARNNSITLRLDELNSGISTLLQTASTTAKSSQFSTPPQLSVLDLLDGFAVVDRSQPTHAADRQLCQQLDQRFGQFRRHGNVFEQQRLRQLFVLFEHDVAGGRRRHQLR